jgi:drug/metabolite transporter (DMT)-like permease
MSPAETIRKQRARIVIAFALVYVLWGSTYLAMRVVVQHMGPALMGGTRFLISGSIMMAACAALKQKIAITRADVWPLVGTGVLLLTMGNIGVAWAEVTVPSGLAALIVAIVPIWVAIIEAWILKSDRLSRRGILGLMFGSAGVAVLLWPRLFTAVGHKELFGMVILLFASLSWSCGSILSRRSRLSIGTATATAYHMLIAGTVNMLIAIALGDFARADWTRSSIWAIAYLVTGGSLLGFTAYVWLLDHVPTAKVATYAYVNPIVAVVLGALILHEKIDAYIIAGSVVIVAGVLLVTTSKIKSGAGSVKKNPELVAREAIAD